MLSEYTWVFHEYESIPGEFLKWKSQRDVRCIICNCYNSKAHKIINGPPQGNVMVPCPAHIEMEKKKHRKGKGYDIIRILFSTLKVSYPSFFIRKFGAVVNDKQTEHLLKIWKSFKDMGVKLKHKDSTSRSFSSAYHFGVWRRYKCIPHITRDSNSSEPAVRAASDALMKTLCKYVASKISTFTEQYSPDYWTKQM